MNTNFDSAFSILTQAYHRAESAVQVGAIPFYPIPSDDIPLEKLRRVCKADAVPFFFSIWPNTSSKSGPSSAGSEDNIDADHLPTRKDTRSDLNLSAVRVVTEELKKGLEGVCMALCFLGGELPMAVSLDHVVASICVASRYSREIIILELICRAISMLVNHVLGGVDVIACGASGGLAFLCGVLNGIEFSPENASLVEEALSCLRAVIPRLPAQIDIQARGGSGLSQLVEVSWQVSGDRKGFTASSEVRPILRAAIVYELVQLLRQLLARGFFSLALQCVGVIKVILNGPDFTRVTNRLRLYWRTALLSGLEECFHRYLPEPTHSVFQKEDKARSDALASPRGESGRPSTPASPSSPGRRPIAESYWQKEGGRLLQMFLSCFACYCDRIPSHRLEKELQQYFAYRKPQRKSQAASSGAVVTEEGKCIQPTWGSFSGASPGISLSEEEEALEENERGKKECYHKEEMGHPNDEVLFLFYLVSACTSIIHRSVYSHDGEGGERARTAAFSPLLNLFYKVPESIIPLFAEVRVVEVVSRAALRLLQGAGGEQNETTAVSGGPSSPRAGNPREVVQSRRRRPIMPLAEQEVETNPIGDGMPMFVQAVQSSSTPLEMQSGTRSQVGSSALLMNSTATFLAQDEGISGTSGEAAQAPLEDSGENLVEELGTISVLRGSDSSVAPLLEFLLVLLPPPPSSVGHADFASVTVPFYQWSCENSTGRRNPLSDELSVMLEVLYQRGRFRSPQHVHLRPWTRRLRRNDISHVASQSKSSRESTARTMLASLILSENGGQRQYSLYRRSIISGFHHSSLHGLDHCPASGPSGSCQHFASTGGSLKLARHKAASGSHKARASARTERSSGFLYRTEPVCSCTRQHRRRELTRAVTECQAKGFSVLQPAPSTRPSSSACASSIKSGWGRNGMPLGMGLSSLGVLGYLRRMSVLAELARVGDEAGRAVLPDTTLLGSAISVLRARQLAGEEPPARVRFLASPRSNYTVERSQLLSDSSSVKEEGEGSGRKEKHGRTKRVAMTAYAEEAPLCFCEHADEGSDERDHEAYYTFDHASSRRPRKQKDVEEATVFSCSRDCTAVMMKNRTASVQFEDRESSEESWYEDPEADQSPDDSVHCAPFFRSFSLSFDRITRVERMRYTQAMRQEEGIQMVYAAALPTLLKVTETTVDVLVARHAAVVVLRAIALLHMEEGSPLWRAESFKKSHGDRERDASPSPEGHHESAVDSRQGTTAPETRRQRDSPRLSLTSQGLRVAPLFLSLRARIAEVALYILQTPVYNTHSWGSAPSVHPLIAAANPVLPFRGFTDWDAFKNHLEVKKGISTHFLMTSYTCVGEIRLAALDTLLFLLRWDISYTTVLPATLNVTSPNTAGNKVSSPRAISIPHPSGSSPAVVKVMTSCPSRKKSSVRDILDIPLPSPRANANSSFSSTFSANQQSGTQKNPAVVPLLGLSNPAGSIGADPPSTPHAYWRQISDVVCPVGESLRGRFAAQNTPFFTSALCVSMYDALQKVIKELRDAHPSLVVDPITEEVLLPLTPTETLKHFPSGEVERGTNSKASSTPSTPASKRPRSNSKRVPGGQDAAHDSVDVIAEKELEEAKKHLIVTNMKKILSDALYFLPASDCLYHGTPLSLARQYISVVQLLQTRLETIMRRFRHLYHRESDSTSSRHPDSGVVKLSSSGAPASLNNKALPRPPTGGDIESPQNAERLPTAAAINGIPPLLSYSACYEGYEEKSKESMVEAAIETSMTSFERCETERRRRVGERALDMIPPGLRPALALISACFPSWVSQTGETAAALPLLCSSHANYSSSSRPSSSVSAHSVLTIRFIAEHHPQLLHTAAESLLQRSAPPHLAYVAGSSAATYPDPRTAPPLSSEEQRYGGVLQRLLGEVAQTLGTCLHLVPLQGSFSCVQQQPSRFAVRATLQEAMAGSSRVGTAVSTAMYVHFGCLDGRRTRALMKKLESCYKGVLLGPDGRPFFMESEADPNTLQEEEAPVLVTPTVNSATPPPSAVAFRGILPNVATASANIPATIPTGEPHSPSWNAQPSPQMVGTSTPTRQFSSKMMGDCSMSIRRLSVSKLQETSEGSPRPITAHSPTSQPRLCSRSTAGGDGATRTSSNGHVEPQRTHSSNPGAFNSPTRAHPANVRLSNCCRCVTVKGYQLRYLTYTSGLKFSLLLLPHITLERIAAMVAYKAQTWLREHPEQAAGFHSMVQLRQGSQQGLNRTSLRSGRTAERGLEISPRQILFVVNGKPFVRPLATLAQLINAARGTEGVFQFAIKRSERNTNDATGEVSPDNVVSSPTTAGQEGSSAGSGSGMPLGQGETCVFEGLRRFIPHLSFIILVDPIPWEVYAAQSCGCPRLPTNEIKGSSSGTCTKAGRAQQFCGIPHLFAHEKVSPAVHALLALTEALVTTLGSSSSLENAESTEVLHSFIEHSRIMADPGSSQYFGMMSPSSPHSPALLAFKDITMSKPYLISLQRLRTSLLYHLHHVSIFFLAPSLLYQPLRYKSFCEDVLPPKVNYQKSTSVTGGGLLGSARGTVQRTGKEVIVSSPYNTAHPVSPSREGEKSDESPLLFGLDGDCSDSKRSGNVGMIGLWQHPLIFSFGFRKSVFFELLRHHRLQCFPLPPLVSPNTNTSNLPGKFVAKAVPSTPGRALNSVNTSTWVEEVGEGEVELMDDLEWMTQDGIHAGTKRVTVVVSRDRTKVLESGRYILERYANCPLPLDFSYAGEPGIGLGPTLEFFESFEKAVVTEMSLNVWRTEEYEVQDEVSRAADFSAMQEPRKSKASTPTRRSSSTSYTESPCVQNGTSRFVLERSTSAHSSMLVSDSVDGLRKSYSPIGDEDTRVPSLELHFTSLSAERDSPFLCANETMILGSRGLPSEEAVRSGNGPQGFHRRVCPLLFPSPCAPPESYWVFRALGSLWSRLLVARRTSSLRFHPLFIKVLGGNGMLSETPESASKHLNELDPSFEASLRTLEAMSNDELSAMDLNFTYSCPRFTMNGTVATETEPWVHELVPNGAMESVTGANVRAYTFALRALHLDEALRPALFHFREGMSPTVPSALLSLFSIAELDQLLSGIEGKMWSSISALSRAVVISHGYTSESRIIGELLEVLVGWSAERQRLFLKFLTGCGSLGAYGLHPPITIVRRDVGGEMPGEEDDEDDEEGEEGGERALPKASSSPQAAQKLVDGMLPSASTCFHYLKLPQYSSKEVLEERLLKAITEGQGSFDLT